jgi:uncharacterized protein YaaN involved in tellurite resistance
MQETTQQTQVNVNSDINTLIEANKNQLAEVDVAESQSLSVADQKKVETIKAALDMTQTLSIIEFGSEAQGSLTKHADSMLDGVRNKDVGPAGDVMANLMVEIRGLGADNLSPDQKQGFLGKLLKLATPIQKFFVRYESIQSTVDAMVNRLQTEQSTLSNDVVMLDKMYDEALAFFHELALHINAGEQVLGITRTETIPAMQAETDKKTDENESMIAQNNVKDMTEKANDLERKIYDLKLTRTITMQMLPQMRMIQDTDKSLVTKMQSIIVNTIPMWKQQLALAITLFNQQKATKAVTAVTDATNEMLVKNSALLRQNNKDAKTAIERGIVDIETIKVVNADLIATMTESIEISKAGQKARREGDVEMQNCQKQLKAALKNAAKETLNA